MARNQNDLQPISRLIFLSGKWVEIYEIKPNTEELSIDSRSWESVKDLDPRTIITICKLNKIFKGYIK